MRFKLSDLEAFAAVGHHLSFTRAAAALGIAQPRLSALIKGFEERLGFAILQRNSRQVSLTEAGANLLKHVDKVLAELEGAAQCAAEWRHRQFGSIRVGAPLSTALIPARRHLIDRFQKTRPDVPLTIVNGYTDALLAMLENRGIDIAIGYGEWNRSGLDSRRIGISRCHLIVAPGDPLENCATVPTDQLAGRAIAVFPRTIGLLHDQLYRPFRAAGCTLVEAPEPATSSLIAFGALNRLPTVIHLWEGQDRAHPRAIPMQSDAFDLALTLFMRSDLHHGPAATLWELACSMA